MGLGAQLRQIALDAGCVAVGVAAAGPFPEVAATMQQRIENGSSAGLGFTYTDAEVATDVRASFPWAESLVVVAHSYLPAAGSPVPAPGVAHVARFAEADHYRPLRVVLDLLARRLGDAGHRAETLMDDRRLVDRAAAVRAGVGWWGKNTMVLVSGSGPWVLLGSVVTDAVLEPDEPTIRSCGSCSACLPACPTGALVAPGVLDARTCLAAILQAPGPIPRALRSAVGSRLYGCDDCLDVCPPGIRLLGSATREAGMVDVLGLLRVSDGEVLRTHAHFFIPGRRPRYLRRNALVVLGNGVATDQVRSMVIGYLGHPDGLLRSHAAWAAGRLGGPTVRAALQVAADRESEPDVAEELALALAGE